MQVLILTLTLAGASSALGDSYTLEDMQAYLRQFPPAHYSSGGREPLLYALVLLLSLQWRAAVAFLARDPSATAFRADAPHLLLALQSRGVQSAHCFSLRNPLKDKKGLQGHAAMHAMLPCLPIL